MTPQAATPAIRLRGVRHNNLKNFDLDLPLGQLIVVTGLSGSGKSSLAFDTLFAEGQRRYIETFSPYARQFFERMDKPQVDSIEGIPPAIAIEQRNSVKTTRSTVGTMTELCEYMKLLWPHLAQLHCRQCGQPVRKDTPQLIWEFLRAQEATKDSEVIITFDLSLSEKLSLGESLSLISKQGYQRLLVEGEIVRLEEALSRLKRAAPGLTQLRVMQDRLKLSESNRARFVEACEHAYHFGKGKLAVQVLGSSPIHTQLFSSHFHCAACDIEYRESSSALFSFNHPLGACPTCRGFGRIISIDYNLAVPDRSKTLAQGVVRPWQTGQGAESQKDLVKFCKIRKVALDVPFDKLPSKWQAWVIEGDPGYGQDAEHEWPRAWYGIKGYFRWLESKAYKMHVRVLLSRYRAYSTCPDCQGKRLQPEALLYRVPGSSRASSPTAPAQGISSGLTLADFYQLPVDDALQFIERMAGRPSKPSDPIALVLNEVRSRLGYLVEVGLGYLTLDRPTRSLSGGETERVNLTTCLGTRLVNTLFVLDEPSVGLHARDIARLVRILQNLRDAGNTVLVVEHDASVMRAADQIVDLGPGQGEAGGQLVFQGRFQELLHCSDSLTGQYLSGRKQIEIPSRRPVNQVQASGLSKASKQTAVCADALVLNEATLSYLYRRDACPTLVVSGASRHNLKNLTVEIPLNRFVCLTGVSGSGKTTLARDVLRPALEARLKSQIPNLTTPRDETDSEQDEDSPSLQAPRSTLQSPQLHGWQHLRRVVLVDQSPLGKTPRSNPAVYIGAFDGIRKLFAQTELARLRGLSASAFSFNSSQGQCERCRGAGFEKIEMQFLSDVFIRCSDCNGRRYRSHILEVKLKSGGREWSIADLLETTVDDALHLLVTFNHLPACRRALQSLSLLQEVGLGYLRLGQPINTLSGGESQRLKLVSHLAEFATTEASPDMRGKVSERVGENVVDGQAPSRSSTHPLTNSRSLAHQSDFTSGATKGTLFLFDEPTTGLHFDDVRVLLKVFQRLVDAGHSLLVIEHNLDVIKSADWLIDLGPEAGERGGHLVAQGTPEQVAMCDASYTGRFLRELFEATNKVGEKVSEWVSENRTLASLSLTHPLTRSPASISPASISIHGAREHNLKNLSLTIPRGRFVVITGVSGSGKSTLAFDLLFSEGQRRFLDSMNTYARQFVEQLTRPDVDLITGIPPTVSIEQRISRGGGKSTVATVTEIYHFLRLLFARLGIQYCPDCQVPVEAQTRDELGRRLQTELKRRGDLLLLAPVVKNRKGFHSDVAEWAAKHGYREIRADGKIYDTSKPFRLDRFREHDVEIVVGVLDARTRKVGHGVLTAPSSANRERRRAENSTPSAEKDLQQLVDEALKLGRGTLLALDNAKTLTIHSTERACPHCGRSFQPLDPKMFSYNSAQGWCPTCRGFGELFYLPDVERGARAEAIEESWFEWQEGNREICPDCQGARLRPEFRAVRLHGVPALAGKALANSTRAGTVHTQPPKCRTPCNPTINHFSQLAVEEGLSLFRSLKFKGREAVIARDILPEIVERLKFLSEVGLGYLQLGRGVTTLSGGEAQRIRLAAQLGSNLSGVLYILDEPTIGLHPRDNEQLLAALAILQSRGNSLVVVEHDEETMRRADYIIDLGPGAGVHGGQLVAGGTLQELLRHPESITGQCLRATKSFPARGSRRDVIIAADMSVPWEGRVNEKVDKRVSENRESSSHSLTHSLTHALPTNWLTLHHATANNLKDLTVPFPLRRLVVVTGVSGSGKSTLVRECLLPAVQEAIRKGKRSAPRDSNPQSTIHNPQSLTVTGHESIQAVYEVDQAPIGRTPRSIPATYVGFFDNIRQLYAQVPEARLRGYSSSRFSFNSPQGRCPDCAGAGTIKLEMNFLPPAFVRCEACGGTRFNRETLDIQYRDKNIAQVLELSVEEAIEFFSSFPKIQRPLQALHDTGLDYLKLGQTSPTLSGGEAQRVKLVTHLLSGLKEPDLFERLPKRNLFILEEPTIGLHMADVRRLVAVLQRLVDAGHSVIVIEHNLDLIAEADWIIDLGPEGGEAGGRIVGAAPPEAVARNRRSHTGRFLRKSLSDS